VSERTSEFFDRYAAGFDAIYGNNNRAFERIINHLFRRAMLVRYQKTLAGCQPVEGRTVIDVGCGPGHYSIALARAGAARVLGLDFAPGMLTIARDSARAHGVAQRCVFALGDFLSYPISQRFDYAVVMGFMDYVSDPRRIIDRVIEITSGRAFFSFPKAGGPLAWQRQLRYRNRCDLFLYREDQIRNLFSSAGATHTVEPIGRDFFVTLEAKSAEAKTQS
jgi:2-polyprenyl-3-methyl-5-hydroxy-6-metoxy-1,4-benzoquinol methylase